ncbi:MAG TPA: amidohydrolase family protein [Candidatus Binataceae bacterium]|nr:amidohydrolase family protein [Candidatus Binataceae bacterium]
MKSPAIDMHAHALIGAAEDIAREHERWRREAQEAARLSGKESAEHNRRLMQTAYLAGLTRVEARLATMDAMGIDLQALSPVPMQYHYWAEGDVAEKIVTAANEGIAAICASRPERFVGLGTVAMQIPELAAKQLAHAMTKLHLKGVIISTAVNGAELADPRFEVFWSKAEELGAVVFIHPMGCSLGARLTPYYLSNVIGNPAETTVALAHLIFSGTFDRHPRLKVVAAHGGGYFPFYTARFDHGWRVRPEAHTCAAAPSSYLKKIWFDSLVYEPTQLEYLIRRAGPSNVVLGTDFPFDMGMDDPLGILNSVAGLSDEDRALIRGGNASRLLALD